VSEFYGLRPDVLLALYVERGLWDRFLARTALGPAAPGCPDSSGLPPSRDCGRALAVALWRTASAQ